MKKIALLSILLFFTIYCKSQQSMPWAVYARGGYSWTTGVLGGEAQIGHFGLGAGWMPTKMPMSGAKISSVGLCLTYYANTWDKNSGYAYLGEATSGYRYEDSNGSEQVESMTIVGLGYKYGSDSFDMKLSVGYGWCDVGSSWTGEITIGVPLFKSKVSN